MNLHLPILKHPTAIRARNLNSLFVQCTPLFYRAPEAFILPRLYQNRSKLFFKYTRSKNQGMKAKEDRKGQQSSEIFLPKFRASTHQRGSSVRPSPVGTGTHWAGHKGLRSGTVCGKQLRRQRKAMLNYPRFGEG